MYGLDSETLQKVGKKYEGGTYYDMNGYSFYVPDNVDSSTAAFIYYPGSGGAGNDAKYIRELIQNGSPSQIIVIADKYSGDNKSGSTYLQLIENIGAENGTDISTINSMCFSASGGSGFNTFNNIVSTYPDQKHSLILNDVVSFNITEEQIAQLKENESTLMFLEKRGEVMSQAVTLAKNGIDVVIGYTSGEHNGHVPLNADIIKGGIIALTSGEATELSNKEIYEFVKYDPTTNKWVQIPFEEVATKFEGSFDPNDPFRYYSKLSGINELQSNNDFIESKVNAIRNVIKNTNFLTGTSFETYESTTNIPNAEPEVVQAFFTACTDMLVGLEKDTRKIAKMGNDIAALNNNLENEANELNSQTYYSNSNSSNKNNTGSTDITYVDSNYNSAGSTGSSYTGGSGGSGYTGGSSGGTVSTVVGGASTVVGGNSSENGTIEAPTVTKKDEELIKEIKEKLLEYDELYSDENKLVYNSEDEYKVVVHYKDDKVLTLEYYFDFETESKANTSIELLKKEFPDIENVVQEGRYVKAIFKEDLYKDLTLKEIKEEFKDLEELVKKVDE